MEELRFQSSIQLLHMSNYNGTLLLSKTIVAPTACKFGNLNKVHDEIYVKTTVDLQQCYKIG